MGLPGILVLFPRSEVPTENGYVTTCGWEDKEDVEHEGLQYGNDPSILQSIWMSIARFFFSSLIFRQHGKTSYVL